MKTAKEVLLKTLKHLEDEAVGLKTRLSALNVDKASIEKAFKTNLDAQSEIVEALQRLESPSESTKVTSKSKKTK